MQQVQDQIDGARTAKDAYRIFAAFTGNSGADLKDPSSTIKNVEVDLLKKKLKHMARVVIDYPELRNNIGNMETMKKTKEVKDKNGKKKKVENQAIMATDGALAGRRKATIYYNAHMDRKGAEEERDLKDWEAKRHNEFNASRDYAGTHELGHVMASTLQDPEDEIEAIIQQQHGLVEDQMIRKATGWNAYQKKLMNFEDAANVKYTDTTLKSFREIKTINPKASEWAEKGFTSRYGAEDTSEFFAEAVSDVYAHGKDAKPISIEVVKEYEKRQQEESKKRFFTDAHKKKPSLLKRFFSWFKFW